METLSKRPQLRFMALLTLVALAEASILLFIHVRKENPVPSLTEPIRISLSKPSPKPASKPVVRKIERIVHKTVTPTPVTSPVLPSASPTSRNLVVAAVGNTVALGWGSKMTEPSTGNDFSPPRLLSEIDTSRLYTPKMKDSEEEGDVVIKVWIDRKGGLRRFRFLVPSVYDDLNNAASTLLKTLRFAPAMSKGNPVEGQFQLNFRFRIQMS